MPATETVRHASRRGSIYLAVLAAAAIISVVGVSSLLAMRVLNRANNLTSELSDARLLAQSGVNVTLQWMRADDTWRTDRPNGVWETDMPLGDGTVTIEVCDPDDDDLDDSPYDPVTIRVTAVRGDSRHMLEVDAEPVYERYAALRDSALHADDDVVVDSNARLTNMGRRVSTNFQLDNKGVITGAAAAINIGTPGSVQGGLTTLPDPLESPDSSAIQPYIAVATPVAAAPEIANRLIAPGPGEALHPVYGRVFHIDTSSDIVIRNVRVYGTLVITTQNNKVTLSDAVLLQPVRPGQPALLVDGDLDLDIDSGSTALREVIDEPNNINILSNGDFADGTPTGWTAPADGTQLTVLNDADAYNGTPYLRVSSRLTGLSGPRQDVSAMLRNNATYHLTARVRMDTILPELVTSNLALVSTGLGSVGLPFGATLVGNSWTPINVQFNTSWTGVLNLGEFHFSTVTNQDILIDNVSIVQDSPVTEVNFNAPGAPYDTQVDNDLLDAYPSEIRGLVHATGTIDVRGGTRVYGNVVSNDMVRVYDHPMILPNAAGDTALQPGYSQYAGMKIVPGSWRQLVSQ